jgi:hypothetical protein
MNNLEQLSERLDSLQSELVRLRVDLSDAIISEKEEQKDKPKYYEFTPEQLEFIETKLGVWLNDKLSDLGYRNESMDRGGFEINIEFDLGDAVREEWGYRTEGDFMSDFDHECEQAREEDETTEQGDEQHQDSQE